MNEQSSIRRELVLRTVACSPCLHATWRGQDHCSPSPPACTPTPTPGVLYNQFLSQVDFELLLAHARELGVLVFENSAKRLMVVTPAGHSDVKRFWKRQKHSS